MATQKIEYHKAYQDHRGHLYYKVGLGQWLYDANRSSLDHKDHTQGVILAAHTVDESKLTPVPGVFLGFYRELLTFADIRKTPGNYEDASDPGVLITVNSIGDVCLIDESGCVIPCNPTGWDTPERRFRPSTKKIEVK